MLELTRSDCVREGCIDETTSLFFKNSVLWCELYTWNEGIPIRSGVRQSELYTITLLFFTTCLQVLRGRD